MGPGPARRGCGGWIGVTTSSMERARGVVGEPIVAVFELVVPLLAVELARDPVRRPGPRGGGARARAAPDVVDEPDENERKVSALSG
jgi:hypothetical protein